MKKRRLLVRGLTVVLLLAQLLACTDPVQDPIDPSNESEPDDTRPQEIEVMNTSAPYVNKYSDADAASAWLNTHIYDTPTPPVTFTVDGASSDTLIWSKQYGQAYTVVDYPEEAPFTRLVQPITYVCEDKQLRIELTLTTYPGYPVLEYDGMLYNEATGISSRLSDLYAIDEKIDTADTAHILHATRGSIYGTTLIPGTDFAPMTFSSRSEEHTVLNSSHAT